MDEFKELLAQAFFGRSRNVEGCVCCGSLNVGDESFKDEVSKKEWRISHLCQQCQDDTFGPTEE
jgi:hypothetical protein